MVEVLIAGVLLASAMAAVSRISVAALSGSATLSNRARIEAAINDMELMMEWLDYGEDSPMEQTLREAGPADLERFRAAAN